MVPRVLIDAFEWENLPAGRFVRCWLWLWTNWVVLSSGDWSTGGNGGCQPTGSWASSNERPTQQKLLLWISILPMCMKP